MKTSTAAANPANRRPFALTSSGCDGAILETYDSRMVTLPVVPGLAPHSGSYARCGFGSPSRDWAVDAADLGVQGAPAGACCLPIHEHVAMGTIGPQPHVLRGSCGFGGRAFAPNRTVAGRLAG